MTAEDIRADEHGNPVLYAQTMAEYLRRVSLNLAKLQAENPTQS